MNVPDRIIVGGKYTIITKCMLNSVFGQNLYLFQCIMNTVHLYYNIFYYLFTGSNSHLGLKQGPMTMNLDDISPYPSGKLTEIQSVPKNEDKNRREHNFKIGTATSKFNVN